MATAVMIAPGYATVTAVIGGSALVSVVNRAALQGVLLNDAHILTTQPPSTVAAVGSAVVGTSTVG